MARITNAQLKASLEARQAEIDALKLSIAATERELREAKAEIGDLAEMITMYRRGEIQAIRNTADAMAKARELALQGTPCYARGLKVFNSRTHEVIAG